ncbi:MAG: prepilin-type N-terminal cleavage/methylation domain-containing protein [Rhodocyclaceae bacterium]
MTNCPRRSAGFTLIEMIMVIVITGILAGIVAVFITRPVQGYVDSVRRAELTDNADVALRRIARDVRLALPNSLRTVPDGFEFIMTKSGGRYRDAADGSTGGNFLNFTAASTDFDVLGTMPTMVANDYVVVYNLGSAPANAYDCSATQPGCNIARIASFPSTNTVRLSSNVFAAQTPPLPSPSARFQVVDQNDLVVRYVCDGATLTRFSRCSLATPSVCAAGALLADAAATCTIDYASAATGRNGLLYISLTLTSGGESVTLFQQIHVDNSP